MKGDGPPADSARCRQGNAIETNLIQRGCGTCGCGEDGSPTGQLWETFSSRANKKEWSMTKKRKSLISRTRTSRRTGGRERATDAKSQLAVAVTGGDGDRESASSGTRQMRSGGKSVTRRAARPADVAGRRPRSATTRYCIVRSRVSVRSEEMPDSSQSLLRRAINFHFPSRTACFAVNSQMIGGWRGSGVPHKAGNKGTPDVLAVGDGRWRSRRNVFRRSLPRGSATTI